MCVMEQRNINPVADVLVAIVLHGKKDFVKNTTHNIIQRHVTGHLQSTPGKLHLPKRACFGVMIVINIEIMGSNCLVDLRLRRKSHGLWRTTRTYQWKYSWYKLDGRGVTGFCAADCFQICRYASNRCWSYDKGSSGIMNL